ncbi:MAG: hypothetical protein ACQES1_04055 [Bacteroidota bacterium]
MKKRKNLSMQIMATMAALLLLFAYGCKEEDEEEDPTGGLDGSRLWGDISENLTLDANSTYQLDGAVHVKSNATLTINEGVTIEANASKTSYLLIEQGGKINAAGTASSPIVFTSDAASPAPGDWGGIMVCGKATINAEGGTGVTEVGNAIYGGSNDNDDSGILQYIRLEYSGIAFDEEHEANGFAFYSVGNATMVDHLQSYKCADDGFEFFGGTVNAAYLVSTHSEDDSFDWTEGWTGKGQYWLANQGGDGGDRGIEGDNNKNNNTTTPYSAPVISNVTLLGGNFNGTYGMKLREGTKANISNIIVTGFEKRSIHVEHNQTITNLNNDDLNVDYAHISNDVSDVAVKYSVSTIIQDGDEIDDPNGPSVDDGEKIENSDNVTISSITADHSTTFTGGIDASTIDPYFESDDNIGSGSDWSTGWTTGID